MGNHSDAEIGWLAGFMDGEGYVAIHSTGEKNFQPVITIRNTHEPSVRHARAVLRKLGVKSTCFKQVARNGPHHKDSYLIGVTGQANLLTFVEAIRPFSVTKAKQLRLMERYLRSRLARTRYKAPYTKSELAIVRQFKTINKRGRPELRGVS